MFKNIWIILIKIDINDINSTKFKNNSFFNIIKIKFAKSKIIIIIIRIINE